MASVVHILLLFLLLIWPLAGLYAQAIKGYVLNEDNQPIPHVNIYLKNSNTGTTTDLNGRYFLKLNPGDYDLVYSFVGYELYELNVVIGDTDVTKNVWLKPSNTTLKQLVVKASGRDPAYDIIRRVSENRKEAIIESLRTDVYIKAGEIVERDSVPQKKKKQAVVEVTSESPEQYSETIEIRSDTAPNTLNERSLVEMNLRLDYQSPDQYKEERSAYKAYGSTAGLYIPKFSEADFNIYENLIHLKGVTETPVISPIGRTYILSYRYKLEETLIENGRMVYKIKVIPRKKGNSTLSGTLYVNEGLWNVNRFEIDLEKSSLKFYDAFSLKQDYRAVKESDSLWIAYRQEFTYVTKDGKHKRFHGSTVIHYSNPQLNFTFPPKHFGNEVSVITEEAYKRDSTYWISVRPEKLTREEQELIHYRDSLHAVINSKTYKDSVEALFNKISTGDIFLHGIELRKHEKQRSLYISPLLSTLDFSVVGGFRVGPYYSYGRRLKNGQYLSTSASMDIGFKNEDLQGYATVFYRYLPFKMGDIQVSGGRSFQSINPYDAYLNQLKISNYILHDFGSASHSIELFNGFYFSVGLSYSMRQSILNYDRTSILNEVIEETDPLVFTDYEAFISNTSISFAPKQKYMREPHYKRVLGSKYPTFSLTHKRGWPDLFSSDINFDYGEFKIKQNLILGIFGNSKYTLRAGKFFNTQELRFIDLRRFRQSDPYLYSDPLNSFQLLDTSLSASDWFLEAHHIHHFNGALMNNIPLIKKLRLNVVAGAGVLWIKESNYRHEELMAGLERSFKLGVRRRLRIGIYGVIGESNYAGFVNDWKISFDLIDTWKKEWSY